MNIWEKMVFRWATFLFKGRGRRDSCWIWGELPKHCRLQSCFDIVVSKTTWECVCGSVLTGWRIGGRTLQTEGGLGQSHGTPSSWRLTGSWEGDTDPCKWNTPWAIPAHLVATLFKTLLRCSCARVFVRVDYIAYILIPRYSFWSTQLKYLTFPPSNVLCSSWSNVMICGNSNFSQNSQKIQRKCELKNIKVEHLLMLFKSRISSLSKKRKNKSCPDWPGAFPAQLVATLASRFSSASVLLR